jgi:3-deoxy-D-manno-octulosonic-acid transferase
MSAPLALYRALTVALGPAIRLYLQRRLTRGKEDPERFGERLGQAGKPRPPGPLVWLHAASVGEATSALALIERLRRERPSLEVLVTTGTVTSAAMLAGRLPGERARHQYVPVDRPSYVRCFLDHWRPDLAIWIESELWPNLLGETRRRGVPTVLLNARLSARSFERWRRLPGAIAPILAGFALCLAQDDHQAERLRRLGAAGARSVGDLKAAAAPLPADEAELRRFRETLAGRPFWLAASTHPGEEEAAAASHRRLRTVHPGLLTIVVPRHPARGEAIAAALPDLAVVRRAVSALPDADTDLYIADTLGELGLFYRLAEIVFVGASLTPKGGHNPLEPALLDCAILHGPDMSNCRAVADALAEANAAMTVGNSDDLARTIDLLLRNPAERARRAAAARKVAERQAGVLDRVLAELAPFLDRMAPRPNLLSPREGARGAAAGR